MNTQERKRYNLVIIVLFITLFILYGGLGLWAGMDGFGPFPEWSLLPRVIISIFTFGFMGAWGFTGLVGGIWLGCRFLGKQDKVFIVLACVFFMFTLMVFWWIGILAAIPYAIYNIVILKREKS
ncbi:MAG: hypothetical protein FWE24_00825 [Defluviitaleaceae bacterium]|nr:hypothetical protein [Defluviitaleaceae bacterium]